MPWRRVLSEAALLDMQGRKASVKRRDFAELVAEAAGLCSEELDLELSGSPHRIFQLLSTRAHAYALCGGGHLHNWLNYVHRFILHYSRRPGSGWRGPSPQEAEEADREVLTEVFRQVHRDSVTLDDALASVVREDFFRHHLNPRPRLMGKSGAEDHVKEGPKKRKLPQPLPRDASTKKRGKVGECFDWAAGKCKRMQCRFPHACAICGDSAHSSKDCPKSS